ncbi:transglycosylase domain-containing protein [Sphingopyxis sp. BSN-002]|uniref:transglycosylase domain-containing protein n=1 Tax=Sphingopyxis sp. BSN-002 TaxID=2911495 RepID=UPI001EDBADC6|nr:transglycosylase domain-containing protein [Sphingopyxis sp. BSN-002]UKK86059.1 transglycosylase domain-containing protein [Sphingopyxis sp. BSN-002]
MFPFRKKPAPVPPPPAEGFGAPYPDPGFPGAVAPPPPESRWRKWTRRASRGFAIFAIAFILLVGWLALTAPLSKSLEPIAPPEITLLASDGTPIARMGAIVDKPVEVAKLPKHVTGAFLAIEDRRFYSHRGVDPRSVGRAVWANVSGGRPQGGSTITQQLAKFTFLTPKRTLGRKAREALIAFWLEAWLSKDEILERYLSNAYFGDNTYGLRAASLHYFSRQPEKLTTAQAAMLAGLVQAPSRLAPTKNPDLAAKRMKLVVNAMVITGYLTEAEAKKLRPPRVDVRSRNDLPTGTYFADWALPEARKLSDVGYSRQTIRTTLDARLQGIARRVTANAGVGKAQVALVAMRPNGEVVAMVGGRDYAASPFNRVTQARRQPGSTFKLFVYLAALRDGKEPDDLIDNRPITSGSYQPKNSGGAYSDTITLENAFAQSSNVAAVRLLREIGDDKVIRMARDLGVTSPLARGDPSLALGTSSMTLLELTAAYAAVAANSYPVVPHAFKEEEEGWFSSLFFGPDHFGTRVHDDIEQMLRAAVNRGTGRAARLPQANFGKTGTSQDNRDALFVGYANGLVVGIWIGNDDNSPHGIAGGGAPARIWRDFMTQASGKRIPAKAPPARAEDPGTPVQPLDIPDIPAVPIADKTSVEVKDGNAVISTEIGGTRVDLRLPVTDRPKETAPPPP